MASQTLPPQGPPVHLYTTIDFTGVCGDCTGVGYGELSLMDYHSGDEITEDNFGSFTYSSDLLQFSIDSLTHASGNVYDDGSAQNIFFGNDDYTIFTTEGGFWSISEGGIDLDHGDSHSWGAADISSSDVPEPASWAMMVGGFGLLGAALRRKKAVVTFA